MTHASLPSIVLCVVLFGCTTSHNNDEPCRPPVAVPDSVDLIEGQQMSFAISLSPAATCNVSLNLDFFTADLGDFTTELSAQPEAVHLTLAEPDATITLSALPDTDTLDESFVIEFYITGTIANQSPRMPVNVVDNGP